MKQYNAQDRQDDLGDGLEDTSLDSVASPFTPSRRVAVERSSGVVESDWYLFPREEEMLQGLGFGPEDHLPVLNEGWVYVVKRFDNAGRFLGIHSFVKPVPCIKLMVLQPPQVLER